MVELWNIRRFGPAIRINQSSQLSENAQRGLMDCGIGLYADRLKRTGLK